MRRILPYILYILALAIEIVRVLLFTYIEKAQPWPLSIVDWAAFVFLCIPAVFFFLLLQQEKHFHRLLRMIAVIKFLSIIAAWFFLIKTARFVSITDWTADMFILQTRITRLFLYIDTVILVLCLKRERSLCK
ncbi:hypothetical protein E4O05_08740 [Treponema sp. OMZ 787]|uniref:hypothetical protein n=1 Tax=Treponema sp. OMZ 787 TaxID=2563669 RepID=UPI0020A38A1F|nr:hypothetical protein [Treponema sp. OMZ 787]UTC61638.1 hypothetical protein E4O05_08740 [Treponema sp. OMZ 787]